MFKLKESDNFFYTLVLLLFYTATSLLFFSILFSLLISSFLVVIKVAQKYFIHKMEKNDKKQGALAIQILFESPKQKGQARELMKSSSVEPIWEAVAFLILVHVSLYISPLMSLMLFFKIKIITNLYFRHTHSLSLFSCIYL